MKCEICTAAIALGLPLTASASLYSEDFNDGNAASRWTTTDNGGGHEVDYAFDYSTLGVASAPNGTGTIGAWFNPNTNGVGSVIGSPNGQSFSGDYAFHVDFLRQNDPDDGGTTEAFVAGVNQTTPTAPFDGAASDGVSYSLTTDAFGGGGQSSIGRFTDDGETRVYDNYGFDDPDDGQGLLGDLDPSLVPNLTSSGFDEGVWNTLQIVQYEGSINLVLNGALLETFANTGGDDAGNILIGAFDQFGSVGDHFLVYDNVVVSDEIPAIVIPEPASLAVFALGGLAALGRRRRG